MKQKSPDILWVFAAIFAAGVLFSAVSEGGDRNKDPLQNAVSAALNH